MVFFKNLALYYHSLYYCYESVVRKEGVEMMRSKTGLEALHLYKLPPNRKTPNEAKMTRQKAQIREIVANLPDSINVR